MSKSVPASLRLLMFSLSVFAFGMVTAVALDPGTHPVPHGFWVLYAALAVLILIMGAAIYAAMKSPANTGVSMRRGRAEG